MIKKTFKFALVLMVFLIAAAVNDYAIEGKSCHCCNDGHVMDECEAVCQSTWCDDAWIKSPGFCQGSFFTCVHKVYNYCGNSMRPIIGYTYGFNCQDCTEGMI